jgi:hypothetical protein
MAEDRDRWLALVDTVMNLRTSVVLVMQILDTVIPCSIMSSIADLYGGM